MRNLYAGGAAFGSTSQLREQSGKRREALRTGGTGVSGRIRAHGRTVSFSLRDRETNLLIHVIEPPLSEYFLNQGNAASKSLG